MDFLADQFMLRLNDDSLAKHADGLFVANEKNVAFNERRLYTEWRKLRDFDDDEDTWSIPVAAGIAHMSLNAPPEYIDEWKELLAAFRKKHA